MESQIGAKQAMLNSSSSVVRSGAALAALLTAVVAPGATRDLGDGFRDHGVATPVSNHRGTVATQDGQGHDVVLIWLFDKRGGYAILMVDVDTGTSRQIATPFPPAGDCPYASLLSSRNRYYTQFASHFVEFDPVAGTFTFCEKTKPQMAMGMTEDDDGRIWAVSYPNSGVVCFDPETEKLRDYGWVHDENWRQYQRYVATDDAGWLYFGIGSTCGQIISLEPVTGEATPIIETGDRVQGTASVYRDMNGKVYGCNGADVWYELHRGDARKLPESARVQRKPIIAGSQSLVHREFPSGRRLTVCDTVERHLTVTDPRSDQVKKITFNYTSEGAHIMGIAAAPDDTLCGGTAFPMRFFSYDPKTDAWINRAAYGQWNTVARQGGQFFAGGDGHGFLLEWDPSEPWVPTVAGGGRPETIGWGYTGRDHYHFKGMIDDVRIHDRALTAEELTSHSRGNGVACWAFDEGEGATAGDSSRNKNRATIHGAEWVPGKSGKALKLDGMDDYVEVPDSPSLRVREALTVEAWVYPTPPHQKGYGGIINNIAGHANSRLLILNSGDTMAQVFIGGSTQTVKGPAVKNGTWNHVAYVYDGAREYWVVNGVRGKEYPRNGALHTISNPTFLTQSHPDINRPHDLLAYPDGRTLILAGTPGYGYTGGGLLFWDRGTSRRLLRTHEELLPEQATMSLTPLRGGKVLGGSTTSPGTGGEKKAKQAELYVLDLETKEIEWHAPVFPGVQHYTDLCPGPRGLVYGIADNHLFFVFDPGTREVVFERDTADSLGNTNSQQGPRVFICTPQDDVYMLFRKGIALVDPQTFEVELVTASPIPIGPGGDYLDGRIYFGSGSHLYSWELPD